MPVPEEKYSLSAPQVSSFARLGRWVYRDRRWVVVIWALGVAVSLAIATHLEEVLQGTGNLYEGGMAFQAEQRLRQELTMDSDALTVVVQTLDRQALTETDSTVRNLFSQLRALPMVRSVVTSAEQPAYRSPDQRTEYGILTLKVSGNAIVPALDRIEQILNQKRTPELKTFLTGKPVVDREIQRISKTDLARAEAVALPLTLLALLAVFGSIVAAGMPVAMGVMAVSVTLGLLYLIGLQFSISIFAINISSMLGLGLGIDYSLLIVNRFREELAVGHSVEQAVVRTMDTAGRAVFFSGLTVCIGLGCLLLFPIMLLRSLGVAGSLVVVVSMMAALTFLPALLATVGRGIDRGHLFPPIPKQQGMWTAIAHQVVRHSGRAIAAVLLIIGLLTSPFLAARFGLPDARILPLPNAAREGVEVLNQAFGVGESTPILLAVETVKPGDRILSASHLAALSDLVAQLTTDPRVATVTSIVNLDPHLSLNDYQQLYQTPTAIPIPNLATAVQQLSHDSTTVVVVHSRTASHDPASRALVKMLRARSLPGLRLQVAGQTARELDTLAVINQRIPLVLTAMMSVTFVLLCVLLKSVVLPLKAIAMNTLSIGASFGALVWIFQDGNLQTWLHFTPVGYLDILLPVVLFCVLFGLSMDYEVFLLSRIQEAYDRTHHNTTSIVEGLERTGGMITSAALLMIIVTGSFTLTSIIFVKALGFGSAIAVLVDATLIRAILVPATMHLMGKWNWWVPTFFAPSPKRNRE